MTDDRNAFHQRNRDVIRQMGQDAALTQATRSWFRLATEQEYSYHFTWLGMPIIQFPQDIVAMQELLWQVKPELVIETGIARGGSLVFHASILELIGGNGRVLGIDIDIREHNRQAIQQHPMAKRIDMIQGSSIDPAIVAQVHQKAQGKRTLVILDSMHSHQHVLAELNAYAPLVSSGSWLVVLDTVIEDQPKGSFPDRPWDVGNNPKTAVHQFLKTCDRFEIDRSIHDKLQITVAPDGYLRCIKD